MVLRLTSSRFLQKTVEFSGKGVAAKLVSTCRSPFNRHNNILYITPVAGSITSCLQSDKQSCRFFLLISISTSSQRTTELEACALWGCCYVKTHLSENLKGKRKLNQSIKKTRCPLEEYTHSDCMTLTHDRYLCKYTYVNWVNICLVLHCCDMVIFS